MDNTFGPFDFPPHYINEYLFDIFKKYDINLATGIIDGKEIKLTSGKNII